MANDRDRAKLYARKVQYNRTLEEMSDDQIAREIAYFEDRNPLAGSFEAWQLDSAKRELDHRI